MNNCCHPGFFGGIGIGRMSDFCHTCGVEATMVPCHCRRAQSCGCARQNGCDCRRPENTGCGYTTTARCDCD